MKLAQIARTTLFAFSLLSARAAFADIVYDNSNSYSGFDYESPNEYGDQVILAGTARSVTEIQIEYYASFIPHGNEVARVRFYANTGPFWQGNTDAPTPAAVPLYEETFTPIQGYQNVVITVPNVVVPDTFTWTIQFLNIAQDTNNIAGLLFYGVPTVGQSFDDFWELTTDGWVLAAQTDVPKNNFGVQISAVAAPTPKTIDFSRVNNNLRLSWPTNGTPYTLEFKTNLTAATWTPANVTPQVNGTNYQVTLPIGATNQFFHLIAQ
jgi:hypothetical protein